MTEFDENIAQHEGPQISGVWTLSQLEIPSLMEIEEEKSNFFKNLRPEYVPQSIEELKHLLGKMQTAMERHFKKKQIKEYPYVDEQGVKYTFYDFKESVDEYDTPEDLQWVAEITFDMYNHFIKKIGGAVPTEISDPKKNSHAGFSGRRI